MDEPFVDIMVEKFTASADDQNQYYPGRYRFQFLLTQKAPALWTRIANDQASNHTAELVIGFPAKVYDDKIVVECPMEKAQQVKDQLNTQILPTVNREYVRQAVVVRGQREQEAKTKQGQHDDLQKVLREQK